MAFGRQPLCTQLELHEMELVQGNIKYMRLLVSRASVYRFPHEKAYLCSCRAPMFYCT